MRTITSQTLIITLLSVCSIGFAATNSAYANTRQPAYDRGNRHQHHTCVKAKSNLPLYERRMRHYCEQDALSSMCENYRELHRSWRRILIVNCGSRSNSSLSLF